MVNFLLPGSALAILESNIKLFNCRPGGLEKGDGGSAEITHLGVSEG